MEELLALANKLAGATLATLLFIIIASNMLRYWRWNQDFVDLEKNLRDQLDRERAEWAVKEQKLESEAEFWRAHAIRGLDIVDTQAQVLRVRETKERGSSHGRGNN